MVMFSKRKSAMYMDAYDALSIVLNPIYLCIRNRSSIPSWRGWLPAVQQAQDPQGAAAVVQRHLVPHPAAHRAAHVHTSRTGHHQY